jgi:hypothetical protein
MGLLPSLLEVSSDIYVYSYYRARNGYVLWPPRSPELTPVDLYLWGQLKGIVYIKRHNTGDQLWNTIEMLVPTILNMANVFQQTRNYWCNRARLQIDRYREFSFVKRY